MRRTSMKIGQVTFFFVTQNDPRVGLTNAQSINTEVFRQRIRELINYEHPMAGNVVVENFYNSIAQPFDEGEVIYYYEEVRQG